MRSHQHRAEGQDHLPCPAGHVALDAAQDTVGSLGCEGTVHRHRLIFFTPKSFSAAWYHLQTAEGAHHPTVSGTDGDVEEHRPQY